MYRRFQNRRTVRAEFATEWMVIQRVAGTVEKQIKLLHLTSNIVIMKNNENCQVEITSQNRKRFYRSKNVRRKRKRGKIQYVQTEI